jgi:hypothetical protein
MDMFSRSNQIRWFQGSSNFFIVVPFVFLTAGRVVKEKRLCKNSQSG